MKNKAAGKWILAFFTALILTAAAALGFLYRADAALSDRLYQTPKSEDGQIAVIGIDEKVLKELGPLPWSRSVMAEVIARLSEDPSKKPAVIGVDVVYAGESKPEADRALTSAAKAAGNVVTATALTFGTSVQDAGNGTPVLDPDTVLSVDGPFAALAEVSETGQVNAMFDRDGVIRHAIYSVDTPDHGQIPSFAAVIAERYLESRGEKRTGLPPLNARNMWYLPFSAKAGGYSDGISVSDILDGSVGPDYWADKIILIGPYANGLQDDYATAIDHAEKMYGVEVQANAIRALLNGNFKRELPLFPKLLILFLVSFLAVLLFTDRKVLPSTMLWLGLSAAAVFLCKAAYDGGTVLPVLWIPFALTVIYIGTVARNYAKAAADRKKITRTFGRYVDPAVLKELLKDGPAALKLGGDMTEIAVLFVDIRGFTTMSEGLPPTEVVGILNQYLSLTTDCIMKNHGTLDKFVGDCTMAIWNAPLPQEDYIMNACKAALAMVEGSRELSEKLKAQYGRTVAFGVGVHCGPAVVGNIGASMRMDYTAIGDTVNTASRLESNAPAGTVYISRAVKNALGERIRATSLGNTIRLKGKAEGFEILTLDGLNET